MTAATT